MKGILSVLFGSSLLFFAVSPSSTSYNLKSYDFGNGGTGGSTSTSYGLNGDAGTVNGSATSATYTAKSGLNPTQNTNVPPAPALTNPGGTYDQLKLVVNEGSNSSGATYLIAISSDSFVTTKYVQTDNSIGNSYTLSTYQTYTSWGGAGGFFITGLTQSTTYAVKVRAIQGKYSESAYGPTASASTVAPSISFGLATTLTGVPPFAVGFSGLASGSVFNGDADGTITLSSNARNGGSVYVSSANAGLRSANAGYTINSATADLSVAALGYGAQVISTSQSSGGPFVSTAPFNSSGQNVGGVSTGLQTVLTSASPIAGATASVRFKAKADSITPAATDYTDVVTFVAAMNY